ncbi:MAG: PTS sugar transporter subunit IIC, partial [Thermodesulfobacteriota bacterium]
MVTDLLWHSFVASFVGSGLSLDRKVAFQVMVSRPLVVATVIGFLLGSTTGGLSVGLFFELLFVGDLPIGGYLPSHETAITVVCTAISLFCSTLFGLGSDIFPMITLSTLLVIPLGFVFNGADRVARGYNARFFYDAEERMVRDYRIGLRKNFEGILSLFV